MSAKDAVAAEPGRRLRRDAERNRLRILAAASEAFAEGGLAVTMDEIARRAGVGVGTVYRRFPDKELLIEALFEQRFEGFVSLQAADRGLKEVLLTPDRGQERVARARARLAPVVDDLLERAKADGVLRPDIVGPDLGLIQFMLGAVADVTREVEPELWRRFLGIALDGLRTRREAPSPLAPGPLDDEALDRAMGASRPGVR
jgi:AcrR family transcriptional regulator